MEQENSQIPMKAEYLAQNMDINVSKTVSNGKDDNNKTEDGWIFLMKRGFQNVNVFY